MTDASDVAPDPAQDLPGMAPPAIEPDPPHAPPATPTEDLYEDPPAPDPAPEPEVFDAEPSDLDRWLAAEKVFVQTWLDAEADFKKWKRELTVEPDWDGEVIEFLGDELAVYIPDQAGLTSFSLGTTEFTPDMTRQGVTSMFVEEHLSPRSHRHIMRRMMRPKDSFDDGSLGELMKVLVETSSDRIMAEIKAKSDAKKAG